MYDEGKFISRVRGVVVMTKVSNGRVVGNGFLSVTHKKSDVCVGNSVTGTFEPVQNHSDAFWHYKGILSKGMFENGEFKTLRVGQIVEYDLHLKDDGKYGSQNIEVVGHVDYAEKEKDGNC